MSRQADVVNVTDKLRAFWSDRHDERDQWSVITSWHADDLAGQPSALGCCRILRDGVVMAEAHSTRALRAPKPGAQGMNDTRDAERVQTQAVGRALGLLGYASGTSLEGDTDEPDESGDTGPVMVPKAKAKGELVAALNGDTKRAADLWPFGQSQYVTREQLDDLLEAVKTSPPGEGDGPRQPKEHDASTLVDSDGGREPTPVPTGDRTPDEGEGQPEASPSEGGPAAARAALNKGKGK